MQKNHVSLNSLNIKFFVLKIVWSNFSISSCTNSRNKTKGIGIFRNPIEDNEDMKKLCNDLVFIVTRARVVENQLMEKIARRSLYIFELHNSQNQINFCKHEKLFFIFNSDNHYCS